MASDATISRTIVSLAGGVATVEKAIADARATARGHVWDLAGYHAPNHEITAVKPLVVVPRKREVPPLDATLVALPR